MFYRKTAKGQAEIEGGERQLPLRLRTVLVLVDGKRSALDLRAMLPAATPQTLALLEEGGFIEEVRAPSRRRSDGQDGRNGSAAVPAPAASAPAAVPPETVTPDFASSTRGGAGADSVFRGSGLPSRFDLTGRTPDAAPTDKERAQIERSLRRALGAAADVPIQRVQKAQNIRELATVVRSSRTAIANARGSEVADEFISRFGGLDDN